MALTRRAAAGSKRTAAGGDGVDLVLPALSPSAPETWDDPRYIIRCSASHLARAIRRGSVSSVAVTSAFLDRIAEVNPVLNAVVELNPNALKVCAPAWSVDHAGTLPHDALLALRCRPLRRPKLGTRNWSNGVAATTATALRLHVVVAFVGRAGGVATSLPAVDSARCTACR